MYHMLQQDHIPEKRSAQGRTDSVRTTLAPLHRPAPRYHNSFQNDAVHEQQGKLGSLAWHTKNIHVARRVDGKVVAPDYPFGAAQLRTQRHAVDNTPSYVIRMTSRNQSGTTTSAYRQILRLPRKLRARHRSAGSPAEDAIACPRCIFMCATAPDVHEQSQTRTSTSFLAHHEPDSYSLHGQATLRDKEVGQRKAIGLR